MLLRSPWAGDKGVQRLFARWLNASLRRVKFNCHAFPVNWIFIDESSTWFAFFFHLIIIKIMGACCVYSCSSIYSIWMKSQKSDLRFNQSSSVETRLRLYSVVLHMSNCPSFCQMPVAHRTFRTHRWNTEFVRWAFGQQMFVLQRHKSTNTSICCISHPIRRESSLCHFECAELYIQTILGQNSVIALAIPRRRDPQKTLILLFSYFIH